MGSGRARWDAATESPVTSEPDRQALLADPAIFEAYVADHREALRDGHAGMVTDALLSAEGTPGVDLGSLSCPVVFLYGGQDQAVPPAVAQLASRQVPGSAVKLVAGKGHLFLAEEPRYLLEEMRPAAR